MKLSPKTLATILLAATSANAMDKAVVMTSQDLHTFELLSGRSNVQHRLLQLGIIAPSNKTDIFVFNDASLKLNSDQELILLVSDLVIWLTQGTLNPESRSPHEMRPSTQDYRGNL